VKTGDVAYRGKLVEVTEESVCLMAKTGWRQIPTDRIVTIDLLPEQEPVAEAGEDGREGSVDFKDDDGSQD
nr:hypothetical protein [Desulfuromonadales bacterium]